MESAALTYLFACAGVTFLLTQSSIFDYPRGKMLKLGPFVEDLLSCSFCTGFWVSLLISTYVHLPKVVSAAEVFPYILGMIILHAFAGAMAAYLFDKLAAGAEASVHALAYLPAPDDDDGEEEDEVFFADDEEG